MAASIPRSLWGVGSAFMLMGTTIYYLADGKKTGGRSFNHQEGGGGDSHQVSHTTPSMPFTGGGGDGDAGPNPKQLGQLAVHGFPSTENLRVMSDYACSLSYQKRIPNWVLERFEPYQEEKANNKEGNNKQKGSGQTDDGSSPTPDRSHSKFYSDESVPVDFRVSNGDYQHTSPLSRGHLAAAQFHKSSQKSLDETFNLSTNIVPQDMTMNGCDWYRLEDMVKKMRRIHTQDHMWVVSGPAFVPQTYLNDGKQIQEVRYRVIGKHQVAVPSHMFKVIAVEKKNPQSGDAISLTLSAFLMPNGPIPKEEPLTSYQVPLEHLERTTGLQFFPKLLHPETSLMNGEAAKGANLLLSAPSQKKIKTFDLCKKTTGGCVGSTSSFSSHHRLVAQLRTASSFGECQQVLASPGGMKDQGLQKEFESCINRFSLPPPPSAKAA